MRKYITEKVGIVELFQIIITVVIIALGYYAFATDVRWNNDVDEMGLNACVEVNRRICRIDKTLTVMFKAECQPRLDIHDFDVCKREIQQKYLRRTADQWSVNRTNGKLKNVHKYITTHMERYTVSEVGFLVIIHLILLTLCSHLCICHLPKISRNIHLRTKWNAAVQGVVLFAAGFAAVLIAISTNTIDSRYDLVSKQIQACSMLRYCDRNPVSHAEVDIDAELVINKALDDSRGCQLVNAKRAICILLIILIGMCGVIIFMAMELTTKYEEEMEDDEHEGTEKRDTGGGLDTLIDDQNVIFDDPDINDAASDNNRRFSTYSMMLEPS